MIRLFKVNIGDRTCIFGRPKLGGVFCWVQKESYDGLFLSRTKIHRIFLTVYSLNIKNTFWTIRGLISKKPIKIENQFLFSQMYPLVATGRYFSLHLLETKFEFLTNSIYQSQLHVL